MLRPRRQGASRPIGEAAGVNWVNDQIRMSAPPSMVLLMLNQRAMGPRVGHYRVRCPLGSCLAEAVPGTSNREREIFANLDSVSAAASMTMSFRAATGSVAIWRFLSTAS